MYPTRFDRILGTLVKKGRQQRNVETEPKAFDDEKAQPSTQVVKLKEAQYLLFSGRRSLTHLWYETTMTFWQTRPQALATLAREGRTKDPTPIYRQVCAVPGYGWELETDLLFTDDIPTRVEGGPLHSDRVCSRCIKKAQKEFKEALSKLGYAT